MVSTHKSIFGSTRTCSDGKGVKAISCRVRPWRSPTIFWVWSVSYTVLDWLYCSFGNWEFVQCSCSLQLPYGGIVDVGHTGIESTPLILSCPVYSCPVWHPCIIHRRRQHLDATDLRCRTIRMIVYCMIDVILLIKFEWMHFPSIINDVLYIPCVVRRLYCSCNTLNGIDTVWYSQCPVSVEFCTAECGSTSGWMIQVGIQISISNPIITILWIAKKKPMVQNTEQYCTVC